MRRIPILFWIICSIFLGSCAKQSSPTGGPKDTIPPILISSIPPNESIHFKGQRVEMTFSEMIIMNNPKEQLIITPSIGKDFELIARKKTAILTFEQRLEDSTTYTFNFREAVQDITEKNPVQNFQLAISTGPYVDSLSLEGSVNDMLTGRESKEITVALHSKNDTFNILKHPATIFTKTDKSGKFKISHLKPDLYYIYAIEDKNRNLFADSRSESYAFLKDSIKLVKDTSNLRLPLVRLDTRILKVTSARPYNTYFNIRTSKNLKTYTVRSATDNSAVYSLYGEDQANIKIYNTIGEADSLAVRFSAMDSLGSKLDTMVYVKFMTRESVPEKFQMSVLSTSILADKGLLSARISFSKPVRYINFDSLYFKFDSLRNFSFTRQEYSWDSTHSILSLKKNLDKSLFKKKDPAQEKPVPKDDSKPNDKPREIKIYNELYAGNGAFISVESDTSQRTVQKINPRYTEDFGVILYQINTTQKNLIIQLLDKDFKLVQQKINQPKGQFEDVPAGEFKMRVILDLNQNGVWDPGNYFLRKEPEPIFYYEDEKKSRAIVLKTNWEFELAPMLIKY